MGFKSNWSLIFERPKRGEEKKKGKREKRKRKRKKKKRKKMEEPKRYGTNLGYEF